MRVFVGYGYNDRDSWIEEQVFPVLESMGFIVIHGKDMHGEVLQPEVMRRIEQSDAAVGFFTVREGQGDADFTSHLWVRDELIYANAKSKPIFPIKEDVAKVPPGLLGDRQYISLQQADRLGCVKELARALGRRNIRRIRLEAEADQLRRDLFVWQRTPNFGIRYRTQDTEGLISEYQEGRLEQLDQTFYLNVANVPRRAYVEVDGRLNEQTVFSSGWVTVDAILVRIN